MENKFIEVVISKIEQMSPLVKRFTLKSADGQDLPKFTGGAHVYVQFSDGVKDYSNAYSLCSSPFDCSNYQIAVKKEVNGRGGSICLHDKIKEGDKVKISAPNNLFELDDSEEFLLIGGGIGITPFMSQLFELEKRNAKYKLLYLKHDDEQDVIETELLNSPFKDHISVHVTERGTRCNLEEVVTALDEKAQVYACGNEKLFNALKEIFKNHKLCDKRLHIEQFELTAAESGAYTLVLQKSNVTVEVNPGETVLAAIERIKGPKIQCLCRAGCCGTCEVGVLEGEVLYNDQYYDESERDNTHLLACCCSAKSKRLVLDM